MGAIRFWGGQPVSNWRGSGGIAWSGSTANGIATYGDASTIVAESTATYDGTTLQLTTAGGGLKLDGLDSSDANTLDDYEEGVFTVTTTVASGTLTVNTSIDTLKYQKIGNRVFMSGGIEFSTATAPSGAWSISGLPFTNTNTGSSTREKTPMGVATVINTVSDISPGSLSGFISANSASISMYLAGISAGASMNANYLDAGSMVFVTGSYTTDS